MDDLYGMHNTDSSTIFPDALLVNTAADDNMKRSNEMMTALISKYGEVAEFDGKKISGVAEAGRLAGHDAAELAKTCKLGYRAKHVVNLSKKLVKRNSRQQKSWKCKPEEAKACFSNCRE